MRDVTALAGFAHPVALDRLRKDHGRLAGGGHRSRVGRVHLLRVVAAATQVPDLVVRPVLHHRARLGVLAEEVLADKGAVLRLECLVLAVDRLLHAVVEPAAGIGFEEWVPPGAPDHLDHVPAGATEVRLELLDDLAVAPHRAVEPLQVAVDHEDEVVEPLATGERDRAHRLRLVHLAVAHERPHLAVGLVEHTARGEVLHEPGLVDRHQWAEAHRDGRELPELGHQPRMRVRREATATNLLPEPMELILAEPSLEEGAGVDPGRRVPLHVDEVARVLGGARAPEVVEADLVQRLGRLVARDVAPELRRGRVRLEHDRDRIPAHERSREALELRVTRERRLLVDGNRVHVRRAEPGRDLDAVLLGVIDRLVEQERHPLAPVALDDGVD